MRRRTLLLLPAGLAAAALPACTSGQGQDAAPADRPTGASTPVATRAPTETPPTDPDAALRARVVADVQALRSGYDAAAQAQPSLAPRLGLLSAEVTRHLAALGATAPTASPEGSPAVAADPRSALVALRRAALEQATRRLDDAVAAAEPALARLLAAIGASDRTHAVALGRQAGA